MGEMSRVSEVSQRIDTFNDNDQATPEDVKRLAKECNEAEMSLDNAEIQELAEKINNAISGVSNVDQILEDTSSDLNRAEQLEKAAKDVREEAVKQLKQAEAVTLDLSKASEAQNDADQKIQTTQTDIDSARKDLATISFKMEEATAAADASVIDVKKLSERQEELQTKYIKNENRVKVAREAADGATKQATGANNDLYHLNTQFKNVSESLNGTSVSIGSAKVQALNLQERATRLANEFANKLSQLVGTYSLTLMQKDSYVNKNLCLLLF